jgi:hypothetical protein
MIGNGMAMSALVFVISGCLAAVGYRFNSDQSRIVQTRLLLALVVVAIVAAAAITAAL